MLVLVLVLAIVLAEALATGVELAAKVDEAVALGTMVATDSLATSGAWSLCACSRESRLLLIVSAIFQIVKAAIPARTITMRYFRFAAATSSGIPAGL